MRFAARRCWWLHSPRIQSGLVLILLVTDLFHPVDNLAVELFLNCNVRHGGGGRGSVPMLLSGQKPDHIARPDFLDCSAPSLFAAAASRDDESLTERMGMPRGARTRLE